MRSIITKLVPESIKSVVRNERRKRELKKFEGDKVLCPICGSKFRIFDSFGLTNRENARCLNCSSLERHRLVYCFLRDKKQLFSSDRKIKLLHFAPEEVLYKIFSKEKNIEYYPCDLFPESYTTEVIKMDITDIKYDDGTFDAIICNHVLEHIPEDHKAMSELQRVMKPGGWGIFQVPIDYAREKTYEDFSITDPMERQKAFGQHDHVRWYGRDYKDRLAAAGFIVTEDDYVKSFSPEDIFKYGFSKDELINLCEKP